MMSLLFLTGLLLQDTPPRPAYPQRTPERVWAQLGQCNADLVDMREYAQELAKAIDDRDKQIAELKAKLPKPEATEK